MSKPKLGLTSVEAAALLLSEGKTKDPVAASIMAEEQEFDMDGLHRSALRRTMGFDFRIKQAPNYFHIYSDDDIKVSARSRILRGETNEYGHVISQDAIDRLVEGCMRLKLKYDQAKFKRLQS